MPDIPEKLLERHLAVVIGIGAPLDRSGNGIAQRTPQSVDTGDTDFRRLGIAIDRRKKGRTVEIELRARIALT